MGFEDEGIVIEPVFHIVYRHYTFNLGQVTWGVLGEGEVRGRREYNIISNNDAN